jgi:hypothetical protein
MELLNQQIISQSELVDSSDETSKYVTVYETEKATDYILFTSSDKSTNFTMELLDQRVISRIMKYREVIRNKNIELENIRTKIYEEDYFAWLSEPKRPLLQAGFLNEAGIQLLERIKYLTDEYKAYLSKYNLELNNRLYDEQLYALLHDMD